MNILVLDFETKDIGISEGLGAGWAYKNKLHVIGFSFSVNGEPAQWRVGTTNLVTLVRAADVIVCHNALYDIGILEMLGVPYSSKLIYDTLILAKLYDNRLLKYNLNSLAERYFGENKTDDEFVPIAWELGLVKSKAQNAVKYAKINLDKIYEKYPEVVARYANQDVDLTLKLFNHLRPHLEDQDLTFYSDLIKSVIQSRMQGVRVDIGRLLKSKSILEEELFKTNLKLSTYLQGRNPNSSQQLALVLDELDIVYPRTPLGNPSITAAWIEKQEGPFFSLLNYYKKVTKLIGDFIDKTLTLVAAGESITVEEAAKLSYSRIHPEMNIMGATATGRFSSSNPNLQQQPKRDEFSRPLIRSIFVPEIGEQWYCLDFSAQEPRLQVHYASMIGSSYGQTMAEEWRTNPDYDMHSAVAEMVGIGRKQAKTINLGLAYGMGAVKLSKSLQLSLPEAQNLIKRYHSGAPYLKDLVDAAKSKILSAGFIRTLLGRRLYKDDTFYDEDGREQDYSYKAINKLIQGSAADQTMAGMVLAYRYGINIIFSIHDELTLSTGSILEVNKLKYILENAVKLQVPSKSEVTSGSDFAEQEDADLTMTAEEQALFDTFVKEFVPIKK